MSFQQDEISNKPIKVKFDTDEMDIEEFDFRPVTKGLGFHNKEASPTRSTVVRPEQRPVTREIKHRTPVRAPLETSFIAKEELSKFYGTTPVAKVENKKTEEISSSLEIESGQLVRALAFTVDLTVILSSIVAIYFVVSSFLGIQVDLVKEFSAMSELSVATIVLFSLMFIFYFSILDLGQTLGKGLFGIALRTEKGKDLKVSQTFLRSVITLCSVYLLFFPMFLDFQNKLSDTKVVKN